MTRKICSVLSMVVFLGLLVIAGFLFVPKMLGYDEYAVLSGSMEPGSRSGRSSMIKILPRVRRGKEQSSLISFRRERW